MTQVPYLCGYVNEGVLIDSPEKGRLVAKRAWLQLMKYLMVNDERIKAKVMAKVIPHDLEVDGDLHYSLSDLENQLTRFLSPEHYEQYYADTNRNTVGWAKVNVESYPECDRKKWVAEEAMANDPESALDIGAGLGETSIYMARKGVQVTSINCPMSAHDCTIQYLHDIGEELPINFLGGVFEVMDFGDQRFDTIIAAEVLEHGMNPVAFVGKACALANDRVVLTVPEGSCEAGFLPYGQWRKNDSHTWAFTKSSLVNIIRKVDGIEPVTLDDIQAKFSCGSAHGRDINCLCVVIKKAKDA